MAEKKRPEDRQPSKDHKVEAARMVKRTPAKASSKQISTLSEVVVKKQRQRKSRPSLFGFTMYFLYKNLYILGIMLLRRLLRLRRWFRMVLLRLKGTAYSWGETLSSFLAGLYRSLAIRVKDPFRRIKEVYRQQKPAIRAQRVEGQFPIASFLPVLRVAWKFLWRVLATIFNWVAPIAVGFYLFFTVTDMLNRPMALQLTYDGHVLGYIQSEAVFDEAAQVVRGRTIDQNEKFDIDLPVYEIHEVAGEELLDSAEIADMIISLSGSDFETAFGLYLDNEFVGAVADKDPILNEFERVKRVNSTGVEGERVEFVKSIRFNPELYLSSSVVDARRLVERLRRNESEEETYTVMEGDTPTEIAEKVGMQYADLLRLNPEIEEDLMPGYVLQTKVARPFLSVKNIYVEVTEESVDYERVEVENAIYARGYENVTQEGVDGLELVTSEVTMINGDEYDRVILDRVTLIEPIDERVTVGVAASLPQESGSSTGSVDTTPSGQSGSAGFIWPTTGGTAKTYAGHTGNGVDIAPGGAGHPIYAAASGKVTQVVNGYTGYGHYIVIDHGNGYSTLYAHNSQNYVSVGDYVDQGQVIAAMGRTGFATGNHVHFEVRYNGRYMWPPDYIGYNPW